jgi:hypothetical protein
VQVLGWHIDTGAEERPLLIDVDTIAKVKPLDVTFEPRHIDPDALTDGAGA